MTASRPAPSGGDVAQLLGLRYGVEVAQLERLPSEVDRVEFVRSDTGGCFVLKISAGDGLEPKVRWQHELLRAAHRADGIRVPEIVPTLAGDELVELSDGSLLRLYTWLEGIRFADLTSHSPLLLREWGRATAEMTMALGTVEAPVDLDLSHHWEVLRARDAVDATIGAVADDKRRRAIETLMGWFDAWAADGVTVLPRGVVHQDLNDFNLLGAPDGAGRIRLAGILDFSDALPTVVVADLAVAVAYAMVRKPDPLLAAMEVVKGYVERRPLSMDEVRSLYPLAVARLCVNATTWSSRAGDGEHYGAERMRHTWPTIAKLVRVPPVLAAAAIAQAAGVTTPERQLTSWIVERQGSFGRILDRPVEDADLSVASPLFDFDPLQGDATATVARAATGRALAGRHLTSRFSRLVPRSTRTGEAPCIHLGVDVWTDSRDRVRAPLDGVVEAAGVADDVVILRHSGPGGQPFWSRWVGISTDRARSSPISRGDAIGHLSERSSASVKHLTLQLFDDRELAITAPAMVQASLVPAWRAISPDPSPLLGIERPADLGWDQTRVAETRRRHVARSQRTYYDDDPIDVVRASGVIFADRSGRTYLDAINNVSHVGHANAAVVRAIERQVRRLNTNSRFLYESLSRYAESLTSHLPGQLEVIFLVCTGSEANDLALRISRQVTGRHDVVVIDGAYHGNTSAVTAISPNRYKGPGGRGIPAGTHEVVMPDRYRGPFGYDDASAGAHYAADVERVAGELVASGSSPAAFIAESLMGTAGTIVHPDGYLATAFEHARAVGALCIADEVQVGFGRLGSSFWGFEDQGAVPDIVTMGKPIGNGHPLAAVATTREIATAFDTGMKYFNTFGGNPVSCEVGLAVLSEIRDRGLQQNAADVGSYFLARLGELRDAHPAIGDVRGRGLYIGIDLVTGPVDRTPDAALARRVSEQMKEEGVIVIPTGTADNVLKVKPPLVFTRANADQFVETLDRVLIDRW